MIYKNRELKVGDKLKSYNRFAIVEAVFANSCVLYFPDDANADFYTAEELKGVGFDFVEPEKWTPEEGKIYFYIDSLGVVHFAISYDDPTTMWRYKTGNIFKTQKEAEAYRDSILNKTDNGE